MTKEELKVLLEGYGLLIEQQTGKDEGELLR
jgi:hypothetical protein